MVVKLTKDEYKDWKIWKDMTPVERIIHESEQNNILELCIKELLKLKHLPSRQVRRLGHSNFKQLKELYKAHLCNRSNREEELTEEDNYAPKLHHVIRFVSCKSSKSQILLSIYSDIDSNKAHIRDNGTFLALVVGEFFNEKVLTGDKWLELCQDIEETYGLQQKDMMFIDMIRDFFENESDEKTNNLKYSLEDVTHSSKDIKEYYYSTIKQWSLDLLTKPQSDLDMINANLPMNLWHAFNYYIQSVKGSDEYWEVFCGYELMKKYDDGNGTYLGINKYPKGTLMSSYSKEAGKGRAKKFVPFFIVYVISKFATNLDELKEAQEMILKFNSFTNPKVKDYWTAKFTKMVKEVKLSEMHSFYTDKYKKVFENDDWNRIGDTITSVRETTHKQRYNAWADLSHSKYDQAIWFASTILWFKEQFSTKTESSLIQKFVDLYIEKLNGEVFVDSTQMKTYDYFGTNSSDYKTNNAESRFEQVFEPVVTKLHTWATSAKQDRTNQQKYKKKTIEKFKVFVSDESVHPILKLYPLSIDELKEINILTAKGLHWLHTNDKDNKAEDGFLGMIDDNLKGNLKYKTWPKNYQNGYIKELLEHNKKKYEETKETSLAISIMTLEAMSNRDFSL
mgnify:CR=1 FL=1